MTHGQGSDPSIASAKAEVEWRRLGGETGWGSALSGAADELAPRALGVRQAGRTP